jgi:hypothetical protein
MIHNLLRLFVNNIFFKRLRQNELKIVVIIIFIPTLLRIILVFVCITQMVKKYFLFNFI